MATHAASTPSGRRLSFRGLTFSIRQLLLGTAFVALACLALRGASAWWVSAMFSLAIAALAIGVLLAVYRTAGERAFWTGFAFCGAVHIVLVLYGWHLMASPNVSGDHPLKGSRSRQRLLTARLSEWAHDWIFTRPEPAAGAYPGMMGEGGGYDLYGGYGMDMGGGYDSGMPGGYGGMPGGGYGGGYPVGGYGGGMPGMAGAAGPGTSTMAAGPPPREPPALADFVNVGHSLWTLLVAAAGGWIALVIYSTGPRREAQEAMP